MRSPLTFLFFVWLWAAMVPVAFALEVGFGEVDITPKLGEKPVYMAGFAQNRKATKIHDSLFARAIVLVDGKTKLALVSVDLVGFFHANVVNVRKQLPGMTHVVVSSTHTHEGPDTLGLWGPSPFGSGVDPDYLKSVELNIVKAVKKADETRREMSSSIGTFNLPDLLHDGREPYLKHDEMVVLRFKGGEGKEDIGGILVQWNCHPETIDPKSTQITSDFVGVAVEALKKKYRCPVVYFTGTVGGLMTSMHVDIKDAQGKKLEEGSREKTDRFGVLVAEAASKALEPAKPLKLTPFDIRTREVFIPMENKLYLLGRQLGVLKRDAYLWKDDPYKAELALAKESEKPLALKTEIGLLRLGELDIACIPGEIYPELVLDKVQSPADPGADFPEARTESGIYKQMKGSHRMILGLANDEVGYIIPKRQWDEKPPFCYGRKKSQYGEANSVGPETAPILCRAFAELCKK